MIRTRSVGRSLRRFVGIGKIPIKKPPEKLNFDSYFFKEYYVNNTLFSMKKINPPTGGKKMIIYQTKSGALELKGDFSRETIWATLDQIALVFGRDKSVISRHLTNIYKEKELNRGATVAKNATVQIEGNRSVERIIEYFNLDVIISVGYRVNSKTATEFRQWATKTLRTHIVDGFTINKSRIKQNYQAFLQSVTDVQARKK